MTETLGSKILQLPLEQKDWLLKIKYIFKPSIRNGRMNIEELTNAMQHKAIEKGYFDIKILLESYDFKYFFNN
ncbi:MAG: hypothetical protein ABFR32_07120 [Bacteroidota bacterium]